MSELVTPIPMGTAIPDWLLVAEPMQAGAPRGNFRFAIDVHVVDTPEYFVVVPMTLGVHPPLIDASGTALHRIYAPVKPVHMVDAQQVFFPLEVSAWHNGQALVEARPTPKPPTLLDRLRWIWTGG